MQTALWPLTADDMHARFDDIQKHNVTFVDKQKCMRAMQLEMLSPRAF